MAKAKEEEEAMEFIYLDCENIAPRTLEALGPDQKVFLFLGEKPKKPDWGITESIHAGGQKVEIIHIAGQGNNALDFHIAFYLGRHAQADPKGSFSIVSKDKGFDPLVKHLQAAGLECKRMERMPDGQRRPGRYRPAFREIHGAPGRALR